MRRVLGKSGAFVLWAVATVASAQQWPVGDPAWYSPDVPQVIGAAAWGWMISVFGFLVMVAVAVGIFRLAHRGGLHGLQRWIHFDRRSDASNRRERAGEG